MRAFAPVVRSLTVLVALLAATSLTGCDSLDIPIGFDQSFDVHVSLGDVTGAAAGQPAPADASYPLALSPIRIDLVSSSPQLESNRDKVQSITLGGLTVTPSNNSLTAATPPIDLYVAPAGATSPSQGLRIATLPSVPAGSTAVVSASIDAAAQQSAQPWLTSLDFVFIPVATLSVQQGQTVPGGAADLHVTVGVEATIDALK
ncbi:MAG: hypothetical protein EP329_04800 [Deltaproteobacteria bacterium]|nr:MAG: hypothetical protein EP329_04800 [Deltaproteobacteria bacterium]